jgi:hypothetical protein
MRMQSIEQMQFFPWLEAHGTTWGNGNFSAGTRIAADAGFSRPDTEDAEAAQFNPVAGRQRILHALENGVHGCFSLDARQTCAVRDFVYNILFYQVDLSVKGRWLCSPMLGPAFQDCQCNATLVHSP